MQAADFLRAVEIGERARYPQHAVKKPSIALSHGHEIGVKERRSGITNP